MRADNEITLYHREKTKIYYFHNHVFFDCFKIKVFMGRMHSTILCSLLNSQLEQFILSRFGMWYFFIKSRLDLIDGCLPVPADQVWLAAHCSGHHRLWHGDMRLLTPGQGSRDAANTSRTEGSSFPARARRQARAPAQNCGGNFRFSLQAAQNLETWWQSRTAGGQNTSWPGSGAGALGSGMRHPLVFRRN